METIVIVIHMLAALAIIGLILLQQGKGAEMGASFGAGGSQTLFGARGSGNIFSRATAVIAAIFFATSFGLAIIAKQKANVEDEVELSVPTEQVISEEQAAEDDVLPVVEDGAAQADEELPVIEESEVEAGADAEQAPAENTQPEEETPPAN